MKTKTIILLVILSIFTSLMPAVSTTACISPCRKETPLLGDLNGDGKVNIIDVSIAARAFGSYPGHPRWNPNADINQDNAVDTTDILIVLSNFGKTPAKAQLCPCVLNLKSRGKWITCYIRIPNNYSAKEVNVSSILLGNAIRVDLEAPLYIGEHCLIVKFNRTPLISHLKQKLEGTSGNHRISYVLLTLTWKLNDGTRFWVYVKLFIIT